MNKDVINLNDLVAKQLHRPTLGGYPLYPFSDGYVITDKRLASVHKNDRFLAEVENTYNSPSNIRRIFITANRVKVHYYAPIVSLKQGDKQTLSLQHKYEIGKNAVSLLELKDRLTGNIFELLDRDYYCPNVEEIYFDYSILYSKQTREQLVEILGDEDAESIVNSLIEAGADTIYDDILLSALMKANNIEDISELTSKYPRLRIIGLVPKLDEVIINEDVIENREFIRATVAKSSKTWWSYNKDLIDILCGKNFVSIVHGVESPNKHYISQEKVFKFDSEILTGMFEAYNKKIGDEILKEKYNSAERDNYEIRMLDPIEAFIDRIYAESGDTIAEVVIKASMIGLGKDDMKDLVYEMSKNNRARVANVLGLELE